ncbi:MAG: helix-turn-helix domain-containing protein [Candidatus Aminicenantes bacterium]|nr:helix-turn-helix domain-containing protein [Candidatus Aminicenantes bacterium]
MPRGESSSPQPYKIANAILFLLATAGILFPAKSAELKREYERWVRRSWNTENGLPQNTVYALAQDGEGCLWIGSEGGVAQFDGTSFRVYKRSATPGLASDSITSLSPDPDGSIWIGTFGGGLARFHDGGFTRVEGLAGNRVWSLHRDPEGVLWIVSEEGGVHCLEKGGQPALAVIDDLPGRRITAVSGSEKGILWVGTDGGLAAIRDGRLTVFGVREGLAGDYVYCLFVDGRGCLWVGTTSGLSRIDAEGIRNYTKADGLADDLVRALAEDAQGRLWIGSDKGLTIMEPRGEAFCVLPIGLAGDAIMAIFRDREAGMWVGTSAGGLLNLRRNEVRVHGQDDGMSGQLIGAVCEDSEGRLWAGTRGQGLNLKEDGSWRVFSRRDGLASDFITSVLADRGGRLWIGTLDAGLQFMEKGAFTSGDPRGGAAGSGVLSLFIDRQGDLWVGGNGSGLDHFHDGAWRHYGAAGGLRGGVITALAQDRQGNIWAGSARDGLHVLRRGKWRHHTTADGLAGESVYAIHADENGGIWLGTDSGLCLYRQGCFHAFRHGAEPLNGTILAIIADGAARLWMSTPSGIFCAKRAELEASAPSGGRGVHCRLFGAMSGMRSTACTGGFQPAGCRDRCGRLWFPTQNGLVMIDPERLETDPPPPIPRLDRVQADGMTVSLRNPGAFPPGTTNFNFHCSAAVLSDPRQVEFSSLLQGFEENWSASSGESSRRVASLAAGSYMFRIRARGRSGIWRESSTTFSFSIRPGFHRTPWFFALLLAGIGLVAFGLIAHRRREARKRREDKYRSSSLDAGKVTEYAAALELTMERDKPHLDPDLTLAKLAEATKIPAKHLSQVINEHFGLNFNDFVNRLRVEEAKRLLLDRDSRKFKLLRIAFESGFNSKSVFNDAFRKNTGISPSEFRRLFGGSGS